MKRLGWVVAFASVAVLVPAVACITGNLPPPAANCSGDKTGCFCTSVDTGSSGNGTSCPPPDMTGPICCAGLDYGAAGKTCSCRPPATPAAACRSDQGVFCQCQEDSTQDAGPDSGSFAACPPAPTKWAYCCANESFHCACYATPGACSSPGDTRTSCTGDTFNPCAASGGVCSCDLGNTGSATTCPAGPAALICCQTSGAAAIPTCQCDYSACQQGWTQVATCSAKALVPLLLDAGSGNTCNGYLESRINACTPVPKATY